MMMFAQYLGFPGAQSNAHHGPARYALSGEVPARDRPGAGHRGDGGADRGAHGVAQVETQARLEDRAQGRYLEYRDR